MNLTEEFLKLAPAIFGRYWKTDCAKDLNVTTRTISNWAKGITKPDEMAMRVLRMYSKGNFYYDRKTHSMKRYTKCRKIRSKS